MSITALNLAVESVIDIINGMENFAQMTRGVLGTADGLACEIAPSIPQEVYYDKSEYIPLTLALNGKHKNLLTLSDTLNRIISDLTRRTQYPSGTDWEIVDISSGNLPRIIGRENNNAWIMAGDLIIKIYERNE